MKLKPSGWAELPPELLVTIVSGFSWRQLLSLRRVCVRWHGVITDQVMDSLAGGDKRLEYNWLHGAAEVSTRVRELDIRQHLAQLPAPPDAEDPPPNHLMLLDVLEDGAALVRAKTTRAVMIDTNDTWPLDITRGRIDGGKITDTLVVVLSSREVMIINVNDDDMEEEVVQTVRLTAWDRVSHEVVLTHQFQIPIEEFRKMTSLNAIFKCHESTILFLNKQTGDLEMVDMRRGNSFSRVRMTMADTALGINLGAEDAAILDFRPPHALLQCGGDWVALRLDTEAVEATEITNMPCHNLQKGIFIFPHLITSKALHNPEKHEFKIFNVVDHRDIFEDVIIGKFEDLQYSSGRVVVSWSDSEEDTVATEKLAIYNLKTLIDDEVVAEGRMISYNADRKARFLDLGEAVKSSNVQRMVTKTSFMKVTLRNVEQSLRVKELNFSNCDPY